jgi:hypothetical protein
MPTMRRGDLAEFQRIFDRLGTDGPGLRPDELTDAVAELAQVLAHRPQGVFARLALIAGAFVEWGGSPVPLAEYAPACALLTMQLRVTFSELWPVVGAGRPDPDPDQPPPMNELIGLFAAKANQFRLTQQQAADVALSWFDAPPLGGPHDHRDGLAGVS